MSSSKDNEISHTKTGLVILGGLLLVGYVVFIGNVVAIEMKSESSSLGLSLTGAFGDSFGFITSLFSGVAVVLVYMTYIAQGKELEATRGVMNASMLSQNKHAAELTFMELLGIHKENTDRLIAYDDNGEVLGKGSRVIDRLHSKAVGVFRDMVNSEITPGQTYSVEHQHLKLGLLNPSQQSTAFERFRLVVVDSALKEHGVYYRHLLNILAFLDHKKELLGDDIGLLTRVLSSNLEVNELVLLNMMRLGLSEEQASLIKAFPLFDGIEDSRLLFREIDLQVPFYKE